MAQTLRRFGGRQPLCGIGVTSLIDFTCRPAAARVAANGVDFLEPLTPALPDEPHATVLPCASVIVMVVLLKVAAMWATPSASTTRLVFFPIAITWSPSSCRRLRGAGPSWCGRWYGCADRASAGRGDDGCRGTIRCPSGA